MAEAAVTDDPLGGFLAFLEVATGLARCHLVCAVCGRRKDEGGANRGGSLETSVRTV